jgi:hypothetical protein
MGGRRYLELTEEGEMQQAGAAPLSPAHKVSPFEYLYNINLYIYIRKTLKNLNFYIYKFLLHVN